ncbi:MAG TPA: glycosyltransferase family 39 protein [Bryobacteraceae bacterium]|nr:glycosyltransferase family 39 protein [Bryobacteraceae bacterium]
MSWSRWPLAILCGSTLWFLYFFGLTRTGLLGPDEPRYAAIGRAMAQTGDWITPRLWGHAWFEKPALLYWMTAAAFKAGLGPELAPRLPVALVSLAFLLYFFFALRKEFGQRPAFFGALILATSIGWLAYSHVATPDLPMSAAFSAAMLMLLPAPPASTRRSITAGVLLGLSILAKGLVPLVLFIPALWFLRRQKRALLVILAVAFVVAAPWYILVAFRNGAAFSDEFFGHQQFARFFGGETLHIQPVWFYLPILAAGLFPWTPLALLLFSRKLYQDRRTMLLAAWFVFGFVFFSASRGKLPGYLLPLLPPVAALLGIAIERTRLRSSFFVCLAGLSAALLWLVPTAQDALPDALVSGLGRAPVHFFTAWLVPAMILALICVLLDVRGHRVTSLALIALLNTVLIARFIWQEFPRLDQDVSARGRWTASSESITCIPQDGAFFRNGLNYYAGRELVDCH